MTKLSDPVARWKFALATIDQFKIEITNWIRSFRQYNCLLHFTSFFSETISIQLLWTVHLNIFINGVYSFHVSRDISIFYNSGHFSPKQSSTFQCYTHIELESLPSDYWGYIHFPIVARFIINPFYKANRQ